MIPIYDPYRVHRPTLRVRRPQAGVPPLSSFEGAVLFAWEAVWLATVAIVAVKIF